MFVIILGIFAHCALGVEWANINERCHYLSDWAEGGGRPDEIFCTVVLIRERRIWLTRQNRWVVECSSREGEANPSGRLLQHKRLEINFICNVIPDWNDLLPTQIPRGKLLQRTFKKGNGPRVAEQNPNLSIKFPPILDGWLCKSAIKWWEKLVSQPIPIAIVNLTERKEKLDTDIPAVYSGLCLKRKASKWKAISFPYFRQMGAAASPMSLYLLECVSSLVTPWSLSEVDRSSHSRKLGPSIMRIGSDSSLHSLCIQGSRKRYAKQS